MVVAPQCVAVLQRYLALFKPIQRDGVDGNLWKYAEETSKSSTQLHIANKNIGINKLREIGIEIAKYLGLPSPNNYTSHCFRRTGATSMSNNKASPYQIANTLGSTIILNTLQHLI